MNRRAIPLLMAYIAFQNLCWAQGGYNDDRVMLQGFMWESHQTGTNSAHGTSYWVDWKDRWYREVSDQSQEIADAKFNVIWLPPPSQGEGAGFHPKELYNFSNNYGTAAEHEQMLRKLLTLGVEPIADAVINHRTGSGSTWAKFTNPDWPSTFITSNDEFWSAPYDELSPEDQEIRRRNERGGPDYTGSNFVNWHASRDLDHESPAVRAEIKKFLERLQGIGYRGFRYDQVKGFHPKYIAEYNFHTQPTFAVGEYYDGRTDLLTGWIDGTKMEGQPDPALKATPAFDFATHDHLKNIIRSGDYARLPEILSHNGNQDGLIAVNKNKAVTYVESHDTGFPLQQFDSFSPGKQVLQAYAYILTHPGIPCVYWKHYFEWGHGDAIKAMIRARKYAGVHSGSYVETKVEDGSYVAVIGDKSEPSSTLIVKIGPSLSVNPDPDIWEQETFGDGYSIWVRKTMKAATKPIVDQPLSPFPPPSES